MNFDDFNFSSFDVESEMPTYEPVDNFDSFNFENKPKGNNSSQFKSKSSKTQNPRKNVVKNAADYSEEEENDSIIRRSKKLVKPIMSGQFDPFTHFFITITKVQNLDNCSNRSLFLKIRVHPSIPIIETPCSWCTNRDAIFNVAYSLDFTKIPPFNLGDFTPVIELYRRFNSSNELIAVTLLPLKAIKESIKCGPSDQTLTYLYRETPVLLKDLTSGCTIGSMKTTIAFGFKEHEPLLDPNMSNPLTPNYFSFNHPNGLNGDKNDQKEIIRGVVKPNILPIQVENVSQNSIKSLPNKNNKNRKNYKYDDYNNSDSGSDNDDYKRRSSHHRRHDHGKRRKNKEFNWVDEAISLGWKPPGSSDFDWKSKARAKGWKPPNEALMSDIGVYCDPNGNNMEEFRSTSSGQTEPEITGLPPKVITIPKIEEEEESLASSSNDAALNDIEIFELLNPKLSKKKNSKNNCSVVNEKKKRNDLLISEPQSYSEEPDDLDLILENKKKPELNFVKCVTLFEEAPNMKLDLLDEKIEDSDDSDDDINHDDIQEILNKISQNSTLKSFKQNSTLKSFQQNSTDFSKKISDDSDNDSDIDSDISSLSFKDNIDNQSLGINKKQMSKIEDDHSSNSSSITPIDNDEIKQSVSSIMISDSDSDNDNIKKDDDIDMSSDSDIEHINNLAQKDKEFFEIYNKYMNL